MNFELKKSLLTKDGGEITIAGCLKVGVPIAEWTADDANCKDNKFQLSPAYLEEKKCWLLQRQRLLLEIPSTEEDIVEFNQGIKLLVKSGAFEKLFW